jgi:hypothetical protein
MGRLTGANGGLQVMLSIFNAPHRSATANPVVVELAKFSVTVPEAVPGLTVRLDTWTP